MVRLVVDTDSTHRAEADLSDQPLHVMKCLAASVRTTTDIVSDRHALGLHVILSSTLPLGILVLNPLLVQLLCGLLRATWLIARSLLALVGSHTDFALCVADVCC